MTKRTHFIHKKIKTGKLTHFAVTGGGETAYREIFKPKKRLGTNICSKIVETKAASTETIKRGEGKNRWPIHQVEVVSFPLYAVRHDPESLF